MSQSFDGFCIAVGDSLPQGGHMFGHIIQKNLDDFVKKLFIAP